MAGNNLSKWTKEELLRFATLNKIKVNRSQVKRDIIDALKREFKPAALSAAVSKFKTGGAAYSPTAVKKAAKKSPGQKNLAKKPVKAAAKKKVSAPAKTRAGGKSDKVLEKPPEGSADKIDPQTAHPAFELEDMAQEAKFILGPSTMNDPYQEEATQELPANYGDNKLVLLPRDPYWAYLFWEIQPHRIEDGLRSLNKSLNEVRWVLRVRQLGEGGENYYDVDIDPAARNWYLRLSPPGASFSADIGLLDAEGYFAALASSNPAALPPDAPSEVCDEQWMTSDEEFRQIYAMSGGSSTPKSQADKERGLKLAENDYSSGAVSSFFSSSFQPRRETDFRLRLDAELVLYGEVQPGSEVTLKGEKIDLRPDGTFTARFAVPNGKHVVPVTVSSADGTQTKTIVSEFSMQTKTGQAPVSNER